MTLIEISPQFRRGLQEEYNADNSWSSLWKSLNTNKNGPIPYFLIHEDLIFFVDQQDNRMCLINPRKFENEVFTTAHAEHFSFFRSFDCLRTDVYMKMWHKVCAFISSLVQSASMYKQKDTVHMGSHSRSKQLSWIK